MVLLNPTHPLVVGLRLLLAPRLTPHRRSLRNIRPTTPFGSEAAADPASLRRRPAFGRPPPGRYFPSGGGFGLPSPLRPRATAAPAVSLLSVWLKGWHAATAALRSAYAPTCQPPLRSLRKSLVSQTANSVNPSDGALRTSRLGRGLGLRCARLSVPTADVLPALRAGSAPHGNTLPHRLSRGVCCFVPRYFPGRSPGVVAIFILTNSQYIVRFPNGIYQIWYFFLEVKVL